MWVELKPIKTETVFQRKRSEQIINNANDSLKQARGSIVRRIFQVLEKQLKNVFLYLVRTPSLPLQIPFKLCRGEHEAASLEVHFHLKNF